MSNKDNSVHNYFIQPGYIYLPVSQTKISAVLGSSAAVAIYDKSKKTGGMTHFLYPEKLDTDKPRAIYGDVSTLTLIKMLLAKGSKKKYLEAQLFGGAFNSKYSSEDIGKSNILSARKILERENIPLASEDTGGEKGRKIIFDTYTNEIVILKVDKLRQSDWYPYS
ncbi:MAG: chemotaxis protein CheD [Desulfobacteraceae bacterium]|nr:chemotaxis protein CheD [Desulfobacteraceae bacterium]MCB9494525.1 chemotaxis protein CheD [Desulfobacteraceae bacterium]